MLHCRQQTWLL